MSNTMLKPEHRPRSLTDIYRTYGEFEPPMTDERVQEIIQSDIDYFAKKGKKILS